MASKKKLKKRIAELEAENQRLSHDNRLLKLDMDLFAPYKPGCNNGEWERLIQFGRAAKYKEAQEAQNETFDYEPYHGE